MEWVRDASSKRLFEAFVAQTADGLFGAGYLMYPCQNHGSASTTKRPRLLLGSARRPSGRVRGHPSPVRRVR
jgi:hypothetical protein